MRPAFLDEMSWEMAEVYAAVTDRILINLARYFPYIKDGQEVRGSFEYQAQMLAQMGQVNRDTIEIIAQSLGGADEALKGVLTAAIMDALKDEEPKLRRAAEKGVFGNKNVPPVMSASEMQVFRNYYRQSADKLNLVNTVMLESTQAVYASTVSDITAKIGATQRILNVATGEVVTGVSTWNQVVKSAVNRMVKNGITGFVDHGGHRWSPEAYVAMDVRTTAFNTARGAVWERAEDYGNDLYQVSSHNGARPLCYPWQAKVISRDDRVRDVEDIDGNVVHVYAQSETSYGQAAGLFGINCRHYPMNFIPGVSPIRGEPQDEEENAKTYAESQQQRALERKLREEKRDLEVMKAQGASDEEINAQKQRVRDASIDIKEFCEETGRTRRRNREGAPVRATWPGEKGEITRFDGDYIDANQVPPVKGQIPTATQNVAQQATHSPQNVVQSIDSIETALGITRGQPFSMGNARTWTNPDYTNGGYEYTNNCQRCVQTYELRRRGYNVEAMPKIRRNDSIAWGSEVFENYGTSRSAAFSAYSAAMSEAEVKKTIAGAPDGARYSVYIQWKRSRSAHVFIAEKENGVVQYLDPQTNKRNVEDYFKDGKKNKFRIFRMDDKNITTDTGIIQKTVRKAR